MSGMKNVILGKKYKTILLERLGNWETNTARKFVWEDPDFRQFWLKDRKDLARTDNLLK